MKNKKTKLIIIIVLMIFLTSGCTKYLSDKDNKKVLYESTGQTLPSNILCKPEDKDLLELYKKYDDKLTVKLENLKNCSKLTVYDKKGTGGIWETIFVRPLAFIIIKLGNLIKNYGISVMIIGLLIRIVLYPLSKSSIKQSENMKKAQPEISKIEKKYENKTDKESMMHKSEETMIVYKKYKINPLGGCLVAFIQLPLFLAFLEAINRVPAIFEETLLGLQLGTTPLIGIKNGNYFFIILILAVIASTYFSLRNSLQAGNNDKNVQKQTQFMGKFMIIIISIASLSLPAAIALYWITTNSFTIVQNIIVKRKKD